MEEKALIAGCKRGNSNARQLLYITYAPSMLNVCRRYVNCTETAQDILHDGFIRIFGNIGTYRGEGSFAGWIRRIFVTTALEYLRQYEKMKCCCIPIEECNCLEDELTPSIISKLSVDELYASIAELPSGYRTVFNMYAIEGYSHSEIADRLHIKEKSSQSQLVRARKILQMKNIRK